MGQQMIKEKHTRTIARAVCWRIIATILTVPFTGLATAVFLHVLLTVAHYIHERAWLKIKWGFDNE
jgi:uncharacterized membrane protein